MPWNITTHHDYEQCLTRFTLKYPIYYVDSEHTINTLLLTLLNWMQMYPQRMDC